MCATLPHRVRHCERHEHPSRRLQAARPIADLHPQRVAGASPPIRPMTWVEWNAVAVFAGIALIAIGLLVGPRLWAWWTENVLRNELQRKRRLRYQRRDSAGRDPDPEQ